MQEDMTVIEILGMAVRSEEDAAACYGTLAKKVQNPLVREKYESLAREEINHRRMLVSMYCTLTGENQPPRIPGNPETAEGGLPLGMDSIEDALQFSIERENIAEKTYRDAAQLATERATKHMFDYLADIERGHALLLQAELDAFHRDEEWYANHPEIQLVGP
jgi:rubrerythrin